MRVVSFGVRQTMTSEGGLATVQDALGRQTAVALLGSRQVGKTTLGLDIAERAHALYLDLEAPKGFHVACDDLQPDRRLVVYSDSERYALGPTLQAIGVRAPAEMLTGGT
jgi:hypothetical protein